MDAAATGARPAYSPRPIAWGPCEDPVLVENGLECGSLEVPVDYARPRGAKLNLALSRLRHTGARYQGVVVTNPGGPGGSGLTLPLIGPAVPNGVGDSYDWIGMDPRGVGQSSPTLACQPDPEPGPVLPPFKPRTPSDYRFYVEADAAYNQDCEANSPAALLRRMRTVDVARDIDSLRRALGVKKINYYGFSYGSNIGQVYATLFPGRVRRIVLDGVLDPDKVWYQRSLQVMRTFQRNTDLFFRYLAEHDDTYAAGATVGEVRSRFLRLQDQLYAKPAGGTIGGAELLLSLFDVNYITLAWPEVGKAYSALLNDGDASGVQAILERSSEGADNGSAVFYATTCADAPMPRRATTYDQDARRGERTIPDMSWQLMWGGSRACLGWPVEGAKRLRVDRGRGTPRALLLSETLDAPTPYSGALANRRLWPGSRLVASRGASHAVSLFGIACSDNRVAAYLDTGALPARRRGNGADVTCPGLPAPDPSSSEMRRLRTADPMPAPAREALEDANRVQVRGLLGR